MPTLHETLERLPANVRHALIDELKALNGRQQDDLPPLPDDALLVALKSAINGVTERKRRRVVVTGIGAVTPVGNTATDTWAALVAGQSGITTVTQFDATPYDSQVAGEIKGFNPEVRIPQEVRRMARCSQISVVAAYEAVEDAGLDLKHEDPTRMGVVLGTGVGGQDMFVDMIKSGVTANRMRSRPVDVINGLPNMAAFHISNIFGFRGPLNTVVTACAAGTQAFGVGTEEIRRGAADVMIVGGVEAMISEVFFATFEAMRAVTTQNDDPPRASRPFDATRDGFVIGEGTAIFVLESLEHALARGAHIYAEVLGWGELADAYHIAAPDPEAKGAALCMRNALADASVTPDEVSYINAHAAGTPLGDSHETKGIKDVFGPHAYDVPISSTKSMVGHLFGGAGAIEALACIYAVHTDTIHPTINYQTPDPECDLDYVPNVARQATVNVAMSNSFGLGGQNACLIVGKYRP